jgi:3-methylcrotonyl-CoA carboxylase alpha subunit
VQRPRHIEIQVFGDTQGNYVYLFERDCSVQRRHQKVLEEAPAPGLSEAMRQQMGATAVAAARAVNYVGAGTVEFIVEQQPNGDMNFFFMEMNTRLQVEHPVTEAITGLDLVEWQLLVASGEPLPLKQEQLRITGHAIEARICAENPDNQFLPATGQLKVYGLPEHVTFERTAGGNSLVNVRIDSGVREGDTISPYYDSMIAKLIVHGATREQALARMDDALAKTHIVGLNTNVQFLRYVVRSNSFAQANLDTGLIPREQAALFNQEPVGAALAVAAAVVHTLHTECAQTDSSRSAWTDPWSKRDGWQSHGIHVRAFKFEFRGEKVAAQLRYLHDGALHLTLGDAANDIDKEVSGALSYSHTDAGFDISFAQHRSIVKTYKNSDVVSIFTAKGATQIIVIDLLEHAGETHEEGGRLTAPMPGKVVSFSVKAGDKVVKGQALAVMDAMKMEHTIASPADGVVQELLYLPGDQVVEGAELLKLGAAV